MSNALLQYLGGLFALATLISAAFAIPSVFFSNSTTFASFQKFLLTLSSFTMTASPILALGHYPFNPTPVNLHKLNGTAFANS